MLSLCGGGRGRVTLLPLGGGRDGAMLSLGGGGGGPTLPSMSLSELLELASRSAAHGALPSSTISMRRIKDPIVQQKILFPTQLLKTTLV